MYTGEMSDIAWDQFRLCAYTWALIVLQARIERKAVVLHSGSSAGNSSVVRLWYCYSSISSRCSNSSSGGSSSSTSTRTSIRINTRTSSRRIRSSTNSHNNQSTRIVAVAI